ncbi:MAG: transposase [Cyanobacteria bacterium P01_F01_bin.56]
MAPRKLSDSDKRQITSIYCQPGETTSTLANKFGISSSTVSRVLKQVLPDEEYAKLMKWKRSGERGSFPLESSVVFEQLEAEPDKLEVAEPVDAEPDSTQEVIEDEATESSPEEQVAEASPEPVETPTKRRSRRRSTARRSASQEAPVPTPVVATPDEPDEPNEPDEESPQPTVVSAQPASAPVLESDDEEQEVAAWVSDELEDAEDFDEETDDEDWDDEPWEDEAEDDEAEAYSIPREAELTIHSFDNFLLTKPCYLVVDRMAELITCPLKDFSELGAIPPGEEQARTLPVFDNHRIARRFARRNQRIIKVPDALMLNKTQGYLEAKGITRILFDGQVYALN